MEILYCEVAYLWKWIHAKENDKNQLVDEITELIMSKSPSVQGVRKPVPDAEDKVHMHKRSN